MVEKRAVKAKNTNSFLIGNMNFRIFLGAKIQNKFEIAIDLYYFFIIGGNFSLKHWEEWNLFCNFAAQLYIL